MTKHFFDEDGRRWKAWQASRDVYWPDPDEEDPETDYESIIFVCFSDPSQPQRRVRLPEGKFEEMGPDDLHAEFLSSKPEPAAR